MTADEEVLYSYLNSIHRRNGTRTFTVPCSTSYLNEVLAGGGGDVGEAHQDAVAQDPGGNEVLGGGRAGHRQDGHYAPQTIPLPRCGTHHLAALHQVSKGVGVKE